MTDKPSSAWSCGWYREDDVALLHYQGEMSYEALNESLDVLNELLNKAKGNLTIYIIADEREVTNISFDMVGVMVALHPVYFHPRGGRLYAVGGPSDLKAVNQGLESLRPGAIVLTDTIEEADALIHERRRAYYKRTGLPPQPPYND